MDGKPAGEWERRSWRKKSLRNLRYSHVNRRGGYRSHARSTPLNVACTPHWGSSRTLKYELEPLENEQLKSGPHPHSRHGHVWPALIECVEWANQEVSRGYAQ